MELFNRAERIALAECDSSSGLQPCALSCVIRLLSVMATRCRSRFQPPCSEGVSLALMDHAHLPVAGVEHMNNIWISETLVGRGSL